MSGYLLQRRRDGSMSVQTIVERIGGDQTARWPHPAHLAQVDRVIEEAERRLGEQEQRFGQAAVAGRSTDQDDFELQKMQLLVAILREGRERLRERLPASS